MSLSPEPEQPTMTGGSMTKAELVEEVSRVSDLTKKHSEVIVDTVFKSIIDALHRGEKIELRGFGSFRLRKREPRKGRNPKTGDKVDVPPKKVPYFKPGKELKELINREADLGVVRAVARRQPDALASRLAARPSDGALNGSPVVSVEAGLRDRRDRRARPRTASSATRAGASARRRPRARARRVSPTSSSTSIRTTTAI